MTLILNIETATTLCSVALAEDGKVVLSKEIDNGYTHSENLHVFIDEILKESKKTPGDLSAVAVGNGPGSYTGLRIGVSAAKGLAYALNIPLISECTLKIMAKAVIDSGLTSELFCPMLDARRMEVYCAVYDKDLNEINPVSAEIISSENLKQFQKERSIVFMGDGMPKCKELLMQLKEAAFTDGVVPSAKTLAGLSYQKYKAAQFEDVAYFEPFYLKNFLIK